MSGFKELDFFKRQEAAAIAKKAALEKFRAKAADPALADRLKERTARAAERKAIKDAREVEKAEIKSRDAERAPQAEVEPALQAERVKAEGAEWNASWKPNGKWRGTLDMLPANRALNACNHSPCWRLGSLRIARRLKLATRPPPKHTK